MERVTSFIAFSMLGAAVGFWIGGSADAAVAAYLIACLALGFSLGVKIAKGGE